MSVYFTAKVVEWNYAGDYRACLNMEFFSRKNISGDLGWNERRVVEIVM
jgi:hypothetical protein